MALGFRAFYTVYFEMVHRWIAFESRKRLVA